MRFDNIAQAAVTPGGFQSGVNDIIQAILGADAAKQRAALHAQDAATAQSNVEADRAWRKESLGQQMANSQADRGMRQQEIDNTSRHYANQAAQKGLDNLGSGLDRVGSVGKNIYQMMTGTGDYKPAYSGTAKTPKGPTFSEANARANVELFGDPAGPYHNVVTKDPVLDFGGRQVAGPDGVPLYKTRSNRERRDLTPEERARYDAKIRDLMAAPGVSMGAQVAGSMGTLPGEDIPATTEGAAPISQTPSQAIQKPAIDYNALDAKLQSSTSALGNAYRQFRSGPANDWKGWLTKNKALVDSDTGAPAPK